MAEVLAPVGEDLTLEDHLLDVIRGLEGLRRIDKTIADGETFAEGDWAVLNDSDELESVGASAVANTFPVWLGNAEGRSDVHATGKATILTKNGFIYRTTKFDGGQTYNVGDGLTLKGASNVPTLAGGSDHVHARVFSVPASGIMEIEVVNN